MVATTSAGHLVDPVVHAAETVDYFDHVVRAKLSTDCPYAYYYRNVTWEFRNGVLTLHGSVPTFYLKQMLQTRLRNLPGVDEIDNQVDVVSSVGLSSVRPR